MMNCISVYEWIILCLAILCLIIDVKWVLAKKWYGFLYMAMILPGTVYIISKLF